MKIEIKQLQNYQRYGLNNFFKMGNTHYITITYKPESGIKIPIRQYEMNNKDEAIQYVHNLLQNFPTMKYKWFYEGKNKILIGEMFNSIISNKFLFEHEIYQLLDKFNKRLYDNYH